MARDALSSENAFSRNRAHLAVAPYEETSNAMLLTIFGTPSPLSYATMNVVRAIVEATLGVHAVVQAIFMSDAKSSWRDLAPSARKTVVFFSDCPHPELVELVCGTRAPIIVVADEIEDIVGYVMETRGMDLPNALRFMTQVVSALDGLFQSAEPLILRSSRYRQTIDEFIAEIVDFFGIPITQDQFEAISSRLRGDGASSGDLLGDYVRRVLPSTEHSRERLLSLSMREQEFVAALAREYAPILAGHSLSSTFWSSPLFLDWGRSGAYLETAIDLTGPARFIICGPYLHLPAGAWRVEAEIELRHCFSDNRLGVDVFSGHILCAASMKLPERGRYAFDMDFETSDPLLPVELRFQLMSGAIEGELSLVGVRIHRRGEAVGQGPIFMGGATDL